MNKKVLVFALCCFLSITFAAQAIAGNSITGTAHVSRISSNGSRMSYITEADANLYVDNGTATVTSFVTAYSEATRVSINASLQRYQNGLWTNVETFTATSNSNFVNLEKTCNITTGFSYRVQSTVKVYNGGLCETRVVTTNETSP